MTPPRLARLPPISRREKARLLVEILAIYPFALRRMRSNDLPAMVAAARRGQRAEPVVSDPAVRAATAVRLGKAVVRSLMLLPTDQRCLIRSLVLSRLLARRGIGATLIIGVGRDDEKFEAHAWVEHEGVALLPPGKGHFERLLEL
ncbi:MAG: Transglutaminase-like superfamily [Baekduia sp.]|jgi:hypothetical protein|nr:Transglutaminase-like superfamily [Baekduia sp.]